jgi:hypothetical protein
MLEKLQLDGRVAVVTGCMEVWGGQLPLRLQKRAQIYRR